MTNCMHLNHRFFQQEVNSTTGYFDGLRRCFLTIRVDTSGSMTIHEELMTSAICTLLKGLATRNQNAEDIEFVVKLKTFSDYVSTVNEEFLPPEQLLELVDDTTFACGGGTNLGAVLEDIDREYSRKSQVISGLHSSDPCPMSILITDFMGTDNPSSRNTAERSLLDNRIYQESAVKLCVFVGPNGMKNKVAALAGGEDNVIALDENIAQYLAPVLLGSTINMGLETHIGGNSSSAIPAREVLDRNEDGQSAGESLTENTEELRKELEALFAS